MSLIKQQYGEYEATKGGTNALSYWEILGTSVTELNVTSKPNLKEDWNADKYRGERCGSFNAYKR